MNASALWTDQPPYFGDCSAEAKWSLIRARRSKLLVESDWTQLADAPLNEDQLIAWRQYRQVLRDLPQIFTNPDDVVFPAPPM